MVARRGATTIVRTRHGLTLAAAGIDASNVAAGLGRAAARGPRRLGPPAARGAAASAPAATSAVVVTDTAGRAWREGQTDIAIGAAGLRGAEEFAGRLDAHGNELAVTAPAVADEIAGAAELAQGKLGGRPFAVVRGRADLVLAAGERRPGRRRAGPPRGRRPVRLRRPRGRGARPARRDPADRAPFGAPAPRRGAGRRGPRWPAGARVPTAATRPAWCSRAAATPGWPPLRFAHGWRRVRPATPGRPPSGCDRRLRRLAARPRCRAVVTASRPVDGPPPTRGTPNRGQEVPSRSPTARRSSTRSARSRRAPRSAAATRSSASASLVALADHRGRGVPPVIKKLVGPARVQRQGARRHRRPGLGLPATSPPSRPTATRTTCPRARAVDYTDAPPAFGAALERGRRRAGRDRPQDLHRRRPAPARGAGAQPRARLHDPLVRRDHRRRPDDDERPSGRIADKFAGTDNFRYKFKAVPWTSADEDGEAFPDGQHVAFTHWSAGGIGETDTTQAGRACASTARRSAGRP